MARIPSLEIQIVNMKSLLRTMCDRVHASLLVVEQHLHKANPESLVKVVALDSEVDRMESELDEVVLQILATQQPRAQELRLVYSTAKIAHHIERMGDAVESLAKHLAGFNFEESRPTLIKMVGLVKDLFDRAYSAMFEDDLTRIQEIFALDDAVDSCQTILTELAKDVFLKANRNPAAIDLGMKLVNIASKLEKIADLCCNWAEQTDFAANGFSRRVLKPRKLRVVLLDDNGGQLAANCAEFLTQNLSDSVDITVATKLSQNAGPIPALNSFPVVRFERVSWSRCFLLVNFGLSLNETERRSIPLKTMLIEWNFSDQSIECAEIEAKEKLTGLLSILARSDVSI
ncbi:MAG: hypothetical protein RJB13_739 [Pseudomonadota bacterium]|jgi:phosphate transport system protein